MTRSIYPSLVVTRTPPPASTPPPGRRQRVDLGIKCKPSSVRISGYATAVSEGVAHHCIDAIHLSDDSKRYAAGTIMTPTYVASATWSSTEQLARPSPKRFHPSHRRPLEACCRPWTWWCNDATAFVGYATTMTMTNKALFTADELN